MQGPPAHPSEPAYPCCLPALGELGEITPHEGSGLSLDTEIRLVSPAQNPALLAVNTLPK